MNKFVIAGGSNNAGISGLSPQPSEASDAEEIFTIFFSKNTHLAYFGLNFCLKRVLNNCKKCVDVPQGTCPQLLCHWRS